MQMENDLQNAFNTFNESRATEEQSASNNENAQDENDEGAEQQNNQQGNNEQQAQMNNKFAQMRVENTAMQRTIRRMEVVAKNAGFSSVDDYLDSLNQPKPEQKAVDNNSDPTIQKLEERIKQLEQKEREAENHNRQQQLNQEVSQLVQKYKISQDDWYNFIDQLETNKISYNGGGTLEGLYLQFNFDKIANKRIEDAKQTWLQNQNTANAAATEPPKSIGIPANTNIDKKDKVDFRGMANNFKK